MVITQYLAPVAEPVSLNDLKLHLRIDPDALDEDEYLEGLEITARKQAEDYMGRAIMTTTFDYFLSGWPRSNFIKLPYGNLVSVTSVAWKDQDGVSDTLTVTTDYLVETNGEGIGKIVLPYSVTWPSGTLYPSNPISIRYICGWASADLVPAGIKSAIKLLVAKLYESRGEDVIGPGLSINEDQTAQRLLASYRLRDEFI